MKKGWLCPRCGTIWSPYTDRCKECVEPKSKKPEPSPIKEIEDEHGLMVE